MSSPTIPGRCASVLLLVLVALPSPSATVQEKPQADGDAEAPRWRYDLDLKNASVPDVLEELRKKEAFDLEIIGDATAQVTAHVQENSLERVIARLVSKARFLSSKKGDAFTIYARDAETKLGSEIVVYNHRLNGTVPDLALAHLNNQGFTDLKMSSVPHLSSVLLTGPLKSIRRAVDVLNAIDEAGPIVFIELLVVEYLHGDTFDWSYNLTSGTNAKLSAASINPASVTSNLAFTYNFVDRLTPSFKLNLNALVTKNFAKVVTNPHMAVRHGEDGVIALTEEQYVTLTNVTSTFGTTLTLQQINAGVTLKVNPKVVNGRLILLDLTGEVAVFLPTLTGQYSINRNTITSKVTVTDDQTLIIGGLIKEKDNREENRTPFLGHVPILGWLFKSTSTVRQFSETVMYITPHIGSDRYFREGDMLRQVDAQITQLNERDKVRREKLKSRKKKK